MNNTTVYNPHPSGSGIAVGIFFSKKYSHSHIAEFVGFGLASLYLLGGFLFTSITKIVDE